MSFSLATSVMDSAKELALNRESIARLCRQDPVAALPANLPFPLGHILWTVIPVSRTFFHIAGLA